MPKTPYFCAAEKQITYLYKIIQNRSRDRVKGDNAHLFLPAKKYMKILIIDDSEDVRLSLRLFLKKWSHEVLEADNGLAGWQTLQNHSDISFVISDWSMPEMTGVELCRRIRAADLGRYIYFILLTANAEKSQVIEGLESGADDFIPKPFNQQELRVRIRSGERVIQLEKDLAERNNNLIEYNQKLEDAYAQIRKDLDAAARLQRNLLPEVGRVVMQGVTFDHIYFPCTVIAGDTLNVFSLDEQHLGFYIIDAAGHGIPAALLSIMLHRMLTPDTPVSESRNLLKYAISDPPYFALRSPTEVVRELNETSQYEDDAMQYFTMIYGLLHVPSGRLSFCQAGHPQPVVVRKNGAFELLGKGGMPVGMFPGIEYEEYTAILEQGDRLYLYSDGVTECADSTGVNFSAEKLHTLLQEGKDLPLPHVLEQLEQNLVEWRGSTQFDDDLSVLAIEIT